MTLSAEDKELLRLKRIEQLKRGRETAKANREAVAKAQTATMQVLTPKEARQTVAQTIATQTVEPKEAATEQRPTNPPQREKRPLSNLFGKKPEPKKESPAESAVAGAPTASKPEKKPSDFGEKVKRSWYFFLGGALLVVLGVPILLAGNTAANPIVITFGAGIAVTGSFLFYRGIVNYSVRIVQSKAKGKTKTNCNILRLKDNSVTFDYDPGEEHIGNEMKCRNDGKYYFVQFYGLDGNGTIEPFKIPAFNPAEQYYDPAEAVNCLFMDAVKKYLNYSAGNIAKFSVVVLGIIVALEVIGLIAIK